MPFHCIISPHVPYFYYSPNSHIFFYPLMLSLPQLFFFTTLPPSFASSSGFSSHVASYLPSFLPPSLRWRGPCHVSPLIDRWDVWAGYAVALLGSKCFALFLPPFPPSLLSPSPSPSQHLATSKPRILSYLIMLFTSYCPISAALIDVNWQKHSTSLKSPYKSVNVCCSSSQAVMI